jgi:hypothetical protein
MYRSVIVSAFALGLLIPFGWIELQTYHGETDPFVHAVKFIAIVAAIASLMAQTRFISNRWMMAITSSIGVAIMAEAEWAFWKAGIPFDPRTVSEHGLNIFVFILMCVFAVLAWLDRYNRRNLP